MAKAVKPGMKITPRQLLSKQAKEYWVFDPDRSRPHMIRAVVARGVAFELQYGSTSVAIRYASELMPDRLTAQAQGNKGVVGYAANENKQSVEPVRAVRCRGETRIHDFSGGRIYGDYYPTRRQATQELVRLLKGRAKGASTALREAQRKLKKAEVLLRRVSK